MARLSLPARDVVPSFAPEPDDHLTNLIYGRVTGLVYRQRFRMALNALEQHPPLDTLLEIGCGAGLLLPSLATMFRRVDAADIHHQIAGVQSMATGLGLSNVHVRHGSVLALPLPNGAFSHAVCLSVLEHLRELDAAIGEMKRVVVPGGRVVLGFPTKNLITKGLFRLLGYNDDDIHPSSHRDILAAARRALIVEEVVAFPPALPLDLSLYVVARCRVPPTT